MTQSFKNCTMCNCEFDNIVKRGGQFFHKIYTGYHTQSIYFWGPFSISQDLLQKNCTYLGIEINFSGHQICLGKFPTSLDVESNEMKFFSKITWAFLFVFMV